ncbi:hypothetical protein [Mycolicibacterium fortuitum]|uniref:Uncharacterized protein n=2 Tax=Mycolicibacterium fortuitum TaxID=1766 RepID=A0AAE4VD36_MYCFO|nr:hypothetical protein [Mycolicibacterium fortuitum]MCV7137873.1 hypothetical protein [Mycolicibacterium fortuitum]MDV7193338.1 hypothetical protein [Mycolicibacterium fortuitum]MDV7205981.1 hypothetical protein [Mycolicibacterium fortuitum]MDV7227394.1 hypothetical protein [Mycolicibacterium fortuitum]MDV7259909.1 hypothetical protein [Mycolicibacterium fortuitum]
MNIKVAVIAGCSTAGAAVVLLVAGLVSESSGQRQQRMQAASTVCTTALGIPADGQTTIGDLGGAQAVTVLGNTATGTPAVDLLKTLYRISNWRDLDPSTVAQWVVGDPNGPLPAGAVANPFTPQQPVSSSNDAEHDGYEARCDEMVNELSPEQLARATTTPRTDATSTPEGLRAADTAQSLIGQHITPSEFLARVVEAAYPDTPAVASTPRQAIWMGSRVAPAAATRGDLIAFDYTPDGPTQVAITLGPTAVAATTGLDSPAEPTTVVTGHAPPGNVAIIRFASPTDASSTERPYAP